MPNILYWDIETGKMKLEVETYQLKQYSSYLSYKDIIRPVWMVCASWMWQGQPYTASVSVLDDPERFESCYHDDYHVVKTLYEVISHADILIAHNGDNFDWKMFQWRCVYHGFTAPKLPLMIDTLKASRKAFKAESHSLSYLAKILGVEEKIESPDWNLISKGDRKEIEKCISYNKQDIKSLREIYKRVQSYIRNHPNLNAIIEGVHHNTCSSCGHWDLEKRGFKYTKAGKFQQYQCKLKSGGCGGWSQGKKNLKTVELR